MNLLKIIKAIDRYVFKYVLRLIEVVLRLHPKL